MTGRKIVAHGNIIGLYILIDKLKHRIVASRCWASVKSSHYKRFNLVHGPTQNQVLEHAVDARIGFLHLLDEEDDVAVVDECAIKEVKLCVGNVAIHAHVSTNENAACLTGFIVLVARNLIAWHFAHEYVAQINAQLVGSSSVCQVTTHVAVDSHVAGAHLGAKETCDVAVAHNPLGIFAQAVKRQFSQHVGRAISTTRAHNSLNRWVTKSPHDVAQALFGGSSIGVIVGAGMWTLYYLESPLLERCCALVYYAQIGGHARWRQYRHLVAFL